MRAERNRTLVLLHHPVCFVLNAELPWESVLQKQLVASLQIPLSEKRKFGRRGRGIRRVRRVRERGNEEYDDMKIVKSRASVFSNAVLEARMIYIFWPHGLLDNDWPVNDFWLALKA